MTTGTWRLRALLAIVTMALSASLSVAQAGKQQGQSGGAGAGGAQSPSGASLQGVSYPMGLLERRGLKLPNSKKVPGMRVLCYDAVYGNSGSQPLLLVPRTEAIAAKQALLYAHLDTTNDETAPNRLMAFLGMSSAHASPPKTVRATLLGHPSSYRVLFNYGTGMIDTVLGVKIDTSKHYSDVRNAVQRAVDEGFRANAKPPISCQNVNDEHPLHANDLLVIALDFDSVSTRRVRILNVNVTGQQGTSLNPDAARAGLAGLTSPYDDKGANLAGYTLDSSTLIIVWPNRLTGDEIPTLSINAIYTPPTPGAPWDSTTYYPAGSVVAGGIQSTATPTTFKPDGHYYETVLGGTSCNESPTFSPNALGSPIQDGGVKWQRVGTTVPTGFSQAKILARSDTFQIGQVAFLPSNGNYYIAIATDQAKIGVTGTDESKFDLPSLRAVPETCGSKDTTDWLDIGTATPASATNGQPADLTVSLLNLQFPQVHALSKYNLAAGLVYNT